VNAARVDALIPAAGYSVRFGGTTLKQYAHVMGQPVIAHSIEAVKRHPAVVSLTVALAPDDGIYDELVAPRYPDVFTATGGDSRARTVLNVLAAILQRNPSSEWVLVHDAARPCLTRQDLVRLLDRVGSDPIGGLLALQVTDTVKRGVDFRVEQTLRREETWLAMTPQMFRVGALRKALETHAKTHEVTDESAAMERMGLKPLLVAASPTNIKVTTRGDFTIAEAILRSQGRVK